MKLADRIAAWFGYVPKSRHQVALSLARTYIRHCEQTAQTVTTVKPRPEIVLARTKGIPCS